MKIAYILQQTGVDPASNGVIKKVHKAVQNWQRSGHEVCLFLLCSDTSQIQSLFSDIQVVAICDQPPGFLKLNRFRNFSMLAARVRDYAPDVVYLRFGIFYPGFKRMMSEIPAVVEVNGDDAELRYYGLSTRIYHRLTRKNWFRYAGGFVYVTRELSGFPHMRFRGPAAVIPNGIELADYPAITQGNCQDQPRLVFVGTGTTWHGIDHLIRLAGLKPDWIFDIVGPVDIKDCPDNIKLHGSLQKHEYLNVLRNADVAIGSLAMYRAGIHEACTLKVREYLACALPVILGHRDSDFADVDFILTIPNSADAVDRSMDAIDAFVQKWRGRKVPRELVQHIDAGAKERLRLEFMQRTIASEC